MDKLEGGIWEAFVPGLKRYDAYQYAIHKEDGTYVGKADPYGFHCATRPDVSTKIYDLDTGYQWGDQDWLDYRAKNPPYRRPMNIYECHLGSWRRTGEGQFLSYRDLTSYLVPLREGDGLHPRGAAPGHRAPPGRLLGLSVHRLFRRHQPLRHPRRPEVHDRPAPPGGHRRHHGLGPRPLPPGRLRPVPLRRHPPPTSTPTPGRGSTPTGAPRSSTSAATRCAPSCTPRPCSGWRSTTWTACGWTRCPPCSTWTTAGRTGSGCPT